MADQNKQQKNPSRQEPERGGQKADPTRQGQQREPEQHGQGRTGSPREKTPDRSSERSSTTETTRNRPEGDVEGI